MALRKYCTFTDLEDRAIWVGIYDSTWSDPEEEFRAGKPITISHKSVGREPVAGIMGSEAVIRYKVEDVADLNFINELVGANEERFAVAIKIDDVLEWVGLVIMDEVNWPADSYPYMVDITAVDGITRLLDIDMDNAGTPYPGDYTDSEALLLMLGKIDTSTYWDETGASATWLRTSVEWNEKDYHPTAAADKDPLAYSRFNSSAWLKTKTSDDGLIQVAINDEGNPMPKSVGECLMDLCRCWDARLYLSRGQWRFEQPNMLDTATVYYRDYGTNGTLSDYGQYNPRKSVDCEDIVQLDGSGYTFHAPVRKVVARRAHKSAINLFGTLGSLPFDTDLAETTLMAAAVAGAGNKVRITGKLSFEYNDYSTLNIGVFAGVKITVKLTAGGDVYYLDGSNFNSATPIPAATYPMVKQTPNWALNIPSLFYFWNEFPYTTPEVGGVLDFSVTTPDMPDDGVLTVEIDFLIDTLGGAFNTNTPATYQYRLFDLQAVYRQTSNVNYTAYEVENTTDGSTPTGDTKIVDLGELVLGDGYLDEVGVGNHEASADLITWNKSGNWRIGTGTAYAMTELLCREVLARQKVAARIMQATIWKGGIGMADVLSWDSRIWLTHGGTQDLHDSTFTGEWYVIAKTRTYLNTIVDDETVGDNVHEVIAMPDDFRSFANRDAVMSIGAVATRGGSQLTASYDAGDVLTVLAVADLGFDMLSGAKIHVVNPYTGEYQTFTTDDDYVSGGTEIPVDTTAAIDLPVGSFVVVDVSAVMANAGGGAELWTRTGTVLSPTTANDSVEVTTLNTVAIYAGSTSGTAIYGGSGGGAGIPAVHGVQTATGPGVFGQSTNGYGVRALSTNNYGVYAVSTNNHAIYGTASASGMNGVYGISTLSHGVYGSAAANNMAGVFGIGTAVGVKGTTTNGIGVYGESTGGVGVYAYSTNNFGIQAGSANSTGGQISSSTNVGLTVAAYGASTALFTIRENATTNTILQALVLTRSTTGTAANGIGEAIEFSLENAGGNVAYRGSIEHSLNDATAGSEDSNFTFYHSKAGVKTEICYMGYDATATTEAVRVPYLYSVNGALTDGTFGYIAYCQEWGLYATASDGVGVYGESATGGHGVHGITSDYTPGSYYGVHGNTAAFGDLTGLDYAQFDAVGHFTLHGRARVYIDMLNELVGKRITSAASAIEIDDPEIRLEFKTSCELTDYVSMNIQLNHMRCLGTPVYPHLHWEQASATMPNWLLQYRWQYQGSAKTTGWTYLPWVDNAFSWTTGTLNQITTFGSITPNNDGHSDILQFRVIRDVDNDSGEFGDADGLDASAYALMFDVHVVVDKLGSASEYSDTEEGTTTTTTA